MEAWDGDIKRRQERRERRREKEDEAQCFARQRREVIGLIEAGQGSRAMQRITSHGLAQGGTCCASARAALTERSGSSTKGRTPNIRYFVAKPSIVAIYALFERLSQGFQ